jgi:cell division protein FtsI (penicillin-binding protein 3)
VNRAAPKRKEPSPDELLEREERRRGWIRFRMGILSGVLALGLGLIVSSGYTIMVEDGPSWREMAEMQRKRRLHVVPKRGTIYDRGGSSMAVSVEVPSVSLDAAELLRGIPSQDVPVVARDAANRIASVLGLEPAQVERKILGKRRFNWLKRQISAEEADKIRALSSDDGPERRVRGLTVEGEGRRYYPRRELASALLGFVAPDGEGKDGLEYALNAELAGRVESLNGLRDRSGRLIFSEGIDDERALAGHDIQLAIDQGIQYVAERELLQAMRTFEAKGGSVVVLDPSTGEILALASAPLYNPNDYRESEPEARRDRGSAEAFEPGSTAKIFTIAAGLAAGVVKAGDRLYCENGSMAVDNVTIRDTHPAEWLSLSQVLAVSSNICAAKIGLSLGENRLYEALRRFGFGEKTGIVSPGEATGTLRPRGRPWVQVETAAASFGQGVSMTNLQIALAASSIANGGELMEPILIKRVTTATGEVVRESVPRVRRRVVPPFVARSMAELLVAVTEGEGTGVEAAIDGYRVAGKTATAQKTDPATGRYSLDRYVASFVGFVPAEKPLVTIAVMIDEPMVEHAGGAVAAPIFKRVAKMALETRGLIPRGVARADLGELSASPDPARAAYEALRERDGKKPPVQESVGSGPAPSGKLRLPDMTGMPARAALAKAYNLGVVPAMQGSGLLVSQSPPPGSVVDPGATVTLVFEPAS